MGLFGNKEDKADKKTMIADEKKNARLEKDVANEQKIKTGKVAIKNLDGAKEHLEPGEKIIDYIFGMHDSELLKKDTKTNGVLIATDKRVIFYGKRMIAGFDIETIDYGKISSVEYSQGLVFGEIKIHTSGNVIKFETAMSNGSKQMIQLIKSKINEPSETIVVQSTSEKSLSEQLKDLKELVDMDILTQDEFDAKKKQLLGL